MLRLPAAASEHDKLAHVQHVIKVLRLTKVQDSLVGSEERRGISGGQKKCAAAYVTHVTYGRAEEVRRYTRYTRYMSVPTLHTLHTFHLGRPEEVGTTHGRHGHPPSPPPQARQYRHRARGDAVDHLHGRAHLRARRRRHRCPLRVVCVAHVTRVTHVAHLAHVAYATHVGHVAYVTFLTLYTHGHAPTFPRQSL